LPLKLGEPIEQLFQSNYGFKPAGSALGGQLALAKMEKESSGM
jgi:hypothetical protein